MSEQGDRETSGNALERWLVPAVIVGFCVLAIWITMTFERMPPILKRGIQPSDFPQLVAALIVALTLLMVFRSPIQAEGRMDKRTWGSLGLMGLFCILCGIDFFLALAVFAAALAFWWGERRWFALIAVGLVVPLVVFFSFDTVFEIRFPRGLLTNLWYG